MTPNATRSSPPPSCPGSASVTATAVSTGSTTSGPTSPPVHRFMPGSRLARAGRTRHCQGTLLADWIAAAPTARSAVGARTPSPSTPMAESKRSSGCGARRDGARSARPRRLASRPSSSPSVGTAASGATPADSRPRRGGREGRVAPRVRARRGSRSGPSPAFSYDHREWDDEAAALAASHRVVTYDLRAHGASSPALEPFSRVDELEAVLARWKSSGRRSSASGQALRSPSTSPSPTRRGSRAWCSASPGVSSWTPRRPMTWFEPIIVAVRGGEVERAAELFADSPLMTCHGSSAARVRSMVLDNAKRGAAAGICSGLSRRPPMAGFAEVQVPVLLLSGGHDPVGRSRGSRRARREASPRTPDRVSSGRSSPRL